MKINVSTVEKIGEKEIIEVAIEHFARYGYQKTTLSSIAETIGKQKTAIYYYFKNKEEIFSKIVELEAETLFQEIVNAVGDEESPLKMLEIYLDTRIDTMAQIAQKYEIFKKELIRLLPMIEANRAPYHEQEIQWVTLCLKAIKEQKLADVLHSELAAKTLVNALKGMEIQMYVKEDIIHHQEEIDCLKQILIYGMVKKNKN